MPLASKGDVEDGRCIDTNIGKGQDHNTNKSLSISRVEFNTRMIHRHLETWKYSPHMLHIHVIARNQIPNWWDIPLLMSWLLCMIINLSPIYNKGRLGWQPRPSQHQALVVSDIIAPPTKTKLPIVSSLNPNRK